MSFLLSIFKGVMKFKKLKKSKKISNSKRLVKSVRDSIIMFSVMGLLTISIIGGAFYSVTGAVADLYNKVTSMWEEFWDGGSEEPPADFYDKLTDEQKQELEDTGASLDVKKIGKYMGVEANSVTYTKEGTKITIDSDGTNTNENREVVTVDTSDIVNQYKVNWEFVASVDLAIFEADDVNKTKAIDNASSLKPVFTWKDCQREVTDTWMNWTEVIEEDPTTGQKTVTYNDSASSKENYRTVKEPLAIPDKVSTLFGEYIYSINDNVVLKDEGYCDPYISSQSISYRKEVDHYEDDLEQPQYKTEECMFIKSQSGTVYEIPTDVNDNVFKDPIMEYQYKGIRDGYYYYQSKFGYYFIKMPVSTTSEAVASQNMYFYREGIKNIVVGYGKKPVYKYIKITTNNMTKTKQKILEDQVANIKQNFDPTKFIQYINNCGLSVKDLDLVRECLINIPNGSIIVDNIDRIINGGYGDIATGTNNMGNAQVSGIIPLYLQFDPKWASVPYSDATVGKAGCGVTSMSMVVCGMGGNIDNVREYDTNNDGILTPDEVAHYSTNNGHSTHGQGTMKSLYGDLGAKMGLKVTNTKNPNEVYEALKLGKVAIASMTPGVFTSGSHLIVLTGVPLEGMVSINDPNSLERSNLNWDWNNVVKVQADDFWIVENPNFVTESFIITSYYGATFSDIPPLTTLEVQMQGGGALKTSTGLNLADKDLKDRYCAVDPSIIPYHSKVFINFSDISTVQMPDGSNLPLTGYYTAEDTGGAFQGGKKKIDLYAGTFGNSSKYKDIAMQIGQRTETVRYRKK